MVFSGSDELWQVWVRARATWRCLVFLDCPKKFFYLGLPDPVVFARVVLQVRMSSNDLAPLSVRQERERLVRKRIREVSRLNTRILRQVLEYRNFCCDVYGAYRYDTGGGSVCVCMFVCIFVPCNLGAGLLHLAV